MSASANSVPSERKPFGGRWAYAVLIAALLFVLMPFLFWRATWFGRPLTDAQLQKALADSEHPREIQHALSQIADRILRGDPTVQRWYPDVVRLSAGNVDQIRLTAAWVMGQDNSVLAFHEALLKMLADRQPMVARNAALSLVRFHDTAGRAIIVSMLRPYALPAPGAGVLSERLKPGDVVNTDTLVGHIWVAGQKREVRSAVPGTLDRWLTPDGTSVTAGQPVLALAPSREMVWEALRALYLIGLPEDLPEVDRYARGVEGMPREVQQQAIETSRAIRSRQPQSRARPFPGVEIRGFATRASKGCHAGRSEASLCGWDTNTSSSRTSPRLFSGGQSFSSDISRTGKRRALAPEEECVLEGISTTPGPGASA